MSHDNFGWLCTLNKDGFLILLNDANSGHAVTDFVIFNIE